MFQPSQREPAFLRRKDVQIRTGLARSTIYLYIQQGAFPKPVTLGRRVSVGSNRRSARGSPSASGLPAITSARRVSQAWLATTR